MIFVPFVFLTVYMGIYPDIFLDTMHSSVTNLLIQCNTVAG